MTGLLDGMNNPLMGMALGLLSGRDPGGTFASGAQQGLINMQAMSRTAMEGSLIKAKLDELKAEEEEKKRWYSQFPQATPQAMPPQMSPGQGQMSPAQPGLLQAPQSGGGLLDSLPPEVRNFIGSLPPEQGQQFMAELTLQGMQMPEDRTPADLAALQDFYGPEQGMSMWLQTKQPASTSVHVALDKPLSVSDARQVVMPDGSPAPIGWSPAQIAAAGGTVKPDLSPAQKAVDSEFAKQYAEYSAAGGSADAQKQISQLRDVRNTLTSKGSNLTGPVIGMTPDSVLNVFNPNAVDTTERVQEVVQRNLRTILGPQFTEKEGTALIKRAYNPSLPEATNAKRMNSLITQMELAAKAKQDAATYYEQNGTLAGWKGKIYTINDFDPAKEVNQSGGWSARPK